MMILNLPDRVKYFFQNLSSKTIGELIAIVVILCISFAIALPDFFSDMKEYRAQDKEIKEDDLIIPSPAVTGNK